MGGDLATHLYHGVFECPSAQFYSGLLKLLYASLEVPERGQLQQQSDWLESDSEEGEHMRVIKLEHHSPLGTRTLVDFPCSGFGCQERILLSITHLGAELLHCNALSVSLQEGGESLRERAM